MQPEIQRWVDYWDYLDQNFWGVVTWFGRDLAREEIGWQPAPAVASIGWNLRHLGEMLDYYLERVFRQGPAMHDGPLVTMIPGSQDDGRFCDLDAIAAYHRQVRPDYKTFLENLQPDDLARTIERHGRRAITVAWAVGHIHEHESYHLGKCTLLRSLVLARREPE